MKKREYLYYPYSRCLNETSLKKALLLFDSVVFLDSQPQFMRQAMLYEKDLERAERIEQIYFFLEQNGVVKVINPQPIVNKYDILITTNTSQDLRNRMFCNIALKYSADVWQILYERLPPSFLSFFRPGSGTFMESVTLQNLIRASGNIDRIPDETKNFLEWLRRCPGFDYKSRILNATTEAKQWEVFDRDYKYVIGGNPVIKQKTYQVPFLQASSLRINEALVVCLENGYIPFTDSAVHNELLNLKLENTLDKLKSSNIIQDKYELDIPYELPRHHLALKIVDELLPDEALDNMEFADLLEYKTYNRDLFVRFNERMAELTAALSNISYDKQYYRNLQRIVDKDIMPEISDIKLKLRKSYEENFGKIALQSIGVLAPTLSASLVGGLSFTNALAACALAEMGYLTAVGADKVINAILALKNKKNNSYAYLLNLRDM